MINDILFDLDGTLIDPAVGLGKSILYALDKIGAPLIPQEKIGSFIGPPITWSFMEFCGLDQNTAEKAVKYFREYYNENGIFEHSLYPGIENLLYKLHESGKNIYLATSKPIIFAERIIKQHNLYSLFTYLSGVSGEGVESSKKDIIKQAIDFLPAALESCIMVGDRKFDINGAKDNKIKSIGVLYGYGSRKEFEECGADYIVDNIANLEKLLLEL